MADQNKTAQQGSKPQQLDNNKPAANQPVNLTPEQQAEAKRKELIAKVAAETAAKAAAEPKGPDPKEVAAKALEAVKAKQAAEAVAQGDGHVDGSAGSQGSSGKRDRWPERRKKSIIANPVKFVWDLADTMKQMDPTIRRKDVIQACIDAGVAGYTARTQYQAWYQMQRESQRQAALAEAKRNEQQRKQG